MFYWGIPFTKISFFAKWAETGSWAITNRREQEHTIWLGVVTEDPKKRIKMISFFLGPLCFGFGVLKDDADINAPKI